MTLGNRIRNARAAQDLTQLQLARVIGVKHNTISNWEKNKSRPDPTGIEALCKALKVTPNHLLIGADRFETPSALQSDELAVLSQYRALDNTAKGAVLALLGYYASQRADATPRAVETAGSVMTLLQGRISTQSVAAGNGTYLEDDAFDEIAVVKNCLTKRAAFYVPVSGDSMEPRYHDGDILIVEDAPVPINGIGIFTLDGKGYVKQRGAAELISLNPDYEPIPMDDSITCNGRVIGVLDRSWIAED